MRFRFSLVLILTLGLCFSASAASMIVTDIAGRRVTVPDHPDRIVCVGPGALRLIVYLEAQERVVGVESMEKRAATGRPYWLAHTQLKNLPVIGPGGPGAINKKPDFFNALKAFRQKWVGLLPFNYYTTNIGTAMADAYAFGKTIYPLRFVDVDLAVKADQIYKFLVADRSMRPCRPTTEVWDRWQPSWK